MFVAKLDAAFFALQIAMILWTQMETLRLFSTLMIGQMTAIWLACCDSAQTLMLFGSIISPGTDF